MRYHVALFATAALASPLSAQVYPMPSAENPRIQSVEWSGGEPIVLTALPETTLTTLLEPGETILRIALGGDQEWKVSVSAENDSFQVTPPAQPRTADLTVETTQRLYEFRLEVGRGLQAAYLVRFEREQQTLAASEAPAPEAPENLDWSYRLRGDKSVRPLSVRDNGEKTVIEYAPEQALPAVFAIGPTDDEEVVDGYMRDGRFIIDRVHSELVFRIDKEKATARRNKEPDSRP